jgi:uncharacterized protein
MTNSIPQRVKATVAVAHRSIWEGRLAVAKLPRLAANLADPGGELGMRLEAGTDAAGAPQLRGRITGELGLVCQRCMKPFLWSLQTEVHLRLVKSEAEEKRLLYECEPWLVEDDSLQLQTVVEEEVLLALPIAPRCSNCD